jgi:hypothetical protein
MACFNQSPKVTGATGLAGFFLAAGERRGVVFLGELGTIVKSA